ncbi:MAG: hypothetical protein AAGA85_26925 [Bacteroidota bacterium]
MVEASYYLLSVGVASVLLLVLRGRTAWRYIIGLGLWFSYLLVLHKSEVLQNFDFPPRVPALIVLPAAVLCIVLVNRKAMQQALDATPTYLPVAIQSFRILVELLIFATYAQGVFPQKVTFEGLNFDILVGVSAVIVSIASFKGLIKQRGVLLWNLAGLAILSLTMFSFVSAYYFSDFASNDNRYLLTQFPYLLLPAFLLPIAIFLHAFSIKQVWPKVAVSRE